MIQLSGAQINPILIQQLTGKAITEIPESPTLSWIPGNYASLINRHKDKIERRFGENSFMIKCKSCGRKGKYDVGLMNINTDKEDPENQFKQQGIFVASIAMMQETGRCQVNLSWLLWLSFWLIDCLKRTIEL